MKNQSEYVKSISDRTLTAKGYKFMYKCIDIIAEHKGLNRYSKEFKETKEKFSKIVHCLFIDKGMSKEEILQLINSRKYIN